MATVSLYRVLYHTNRHKYPEPMTDYVVAAAGASPDTIAAAIKTERDGSKSVVIDQLEVVRTNIVQ